LLVLGHGAGGDIEAPDLRAVRTAALAAGISVARVRQPYRVDGRRSAAPAHQLDSAWLAVVAALRDKAGPFGAATARLALFVGGRSSGARVACRTAVASGATGVVALAFPLHPPGQRENPAKSRAPELAVDLPLLVVQGSRDGFGAAAQFPPGVTVCEVPGADHRLVGPGLAEAATDVAAWVLETVSALR
jgi:predicted alpha/beta-hydrolase family hydrolase